VVIDKIRAKVFVFDSDGRLRGATLALLGRARGDDTTPGIGSRKLKSIRPEERTTPAGRFVAFLGHDLERDILWIDYGAAISLHRVVPSLQRRHPRRSRQRRPLQGIVARRGPRDLERVRLGSVGAFRRRVAGRVVSFYPHFRAGARARTNNRNDPR